jgi:hypothetical protein
LAEVRAENRQLWQELEHAVDLPVAKQQQFATLAAALGLSVSSVPFGPERLDQVALVVAGPPEYMAFGNYEARSSVVEAMPGFRAVVDAFRTEGYPVFFTCIDSSIVEPNSMSARKAGFLID